MLIPPVWLLIVQSMGPSRTSEPSLAPVSVCSTKLGGRASCRSEWITFSSVCLFSPFKTKPFLLWPLSTTLSQRPWRNTECESRGCRVVASFVPSLWAERTAADHLIMADFFFIFVYFIFFSEQICYKTREAEITHHDAASLGCTKNSGQAESQVRGPSAFILINTEASQHKKGFAGQIFALNTT